MRPSYHVNISIIVSYFYIYFSNNIETGKYVVWFFIGSVFLDLDYIFTLFLSEKNHRQYITHNLLIWIIIVCLFALLNSWKVLAFSIGSVFHLLSDLLDWGLPIPPILKLTPGHILPEPINTSSERDFARIYWHTPLLLGIELICLLGMSTVFLFTPYFNLISGRIFILLSTMGINLFFFTEMTMLLFRDL